MNCPDCGAEITLPDAPGPIIGCKCDPPWWLMGAIRDEGDE